MTTLSLSSTLSMANTAALRALGSELNGYLATVGLVQQTDTGQVNWTTVTLPAASTAIGYEIWAFPDLSIYFRIDWKTQSTATNSPNMSITVGTGSNGSGAITGAATTALLVSTSTGGLTSTTTSYTTYGCLTPDAFWLSWKSLAVTSGVNPVAAMAFCIEKTCDSAGAANATGYCVSYINSGGSGGFLNKVSVRIASPAGVIANTQSHCIVPGNLSNSATAAGSKQVFLHQYAIPDILLSNVMVSIVNAEATIGTTFTATPVGTTPQTLISMGNQFGATNNGGGGALTWGLALRWQ